MAYRNTLQADALTLVARKLQSSLAVEGELPADGPEPQRSLCSWAEFLAQESPEPKPRRRREAPTLSLFEWALNREREESLAAAG